MSFTIIACVGKNRELGAAGGLVFHIPEDMKFFKDQTMGHKVIMGRSTYESLPSSGLPGREMLVLTRSAKDIKSSHISIISNFADFVKSTPDSEEVFVIGGGSVYAQFLPYCSRMLLTEVDAAAPEADVFFPEFDADEFSRRVIGEGEFKGLNYKFVEYKRR